MSKPSKPRAGSLAFYPRKRAARETPAIHLVNINEGEAKPLNFLGYKAGMVHVMGINAHKGSVNFGLEIVVPATVIECPPIKVFAARAYTKTSYGERVLCEINSEKIDKELKRKIKSFQAKHGKKGKEGKTAESAQTGSMKAKTIADLEKLKNEISMIRLVCHSQPKETGFGKKKPAVFEIGLSGSLDKQIAYAKEKLGGDIKVTDVLKEKDLTDIKAVTKGKGFQGPVKRFGVCIQPRKAKKRRIVGSIGPWNPSTVMWTVARAGQMGYHSRTEFNKKILLIGNKAEAINPLNGFNGYGKVNGEYIVLAGSVAGPPKRLVSLRAASRKGKDKFNLSEIKSISVEAEKRKEKKTPISEEPEETKVKTHKMDAKEGAKAK